MSIGITRYIIHTLQNGFEQTRVLNDSIFTQDFISRVAAANGLEYSRVLNDALDVQDFITSTTGVLLGSLPTVLFTDAETGPTLGGENNAGCYLSVYGRNFGLAANLGTTVKVYIGGQEPAQYMVHADSVVASKFGIKKITVQVGSLNGAAIGAPLSVAVDVAGSTSNTDVTFVPCSGNIYFASLNGNDSTGAANDITKPFRLLQSTDHYSGGIYPLLNAGDHVVVSSGDWNDQAWNTCWLRFRDSWAQGNSSQWIHFTSYPGDVVTYRTPAGAKGGFHGAEGSLEGQTGEYCSFSNFFMLDVDQDAQTDAAPFNEQSGTGPWKVVNCEIGPWPSVQDARAGGYSGGGGATKLLGCYIHDIMRLCDAQREGVDPDFVSNCGSGGVVGGGERLLNHGVYVDGGSDGMEIAYNMIINVPDGNLIQLYASAGGNVNDTHIHHNWLENQDDQMFFGKFGLNLSNGISGALYVHDNIVVNAAQSAVRLGIGYVDMNGYISHNTFINCNKTNVSGYGCILSDWDSGVTSGSYLYIGNNIFYTSHNNCDTFYDGGGTWFKFFGKNIVYLNGGAVNGQYGTVVTSNPQFINVSSRNFSFNTPSPAFNSAGATVVNTGTAVWSYVAGPDIFFVNRPQSSANDIGAIELEI